MQNLSVRWRLNRGRRTESQHCHLSLLTPRGGNFVTLDSSVVAKRKLNRSAQERVFYFPVFLTPSESAAFPMERPSAAGGGEAGANSSKWGSQSSGPTP